jgi:hypothetical protein
LASATDPAERDQARLIVEQGCPRTVLRVARWMSAVIPPAAAGSFAAIVVRFVPGPAEARPDTAITLVLLSTATGAWSTAGSVLPERPRARSQQRAARAASAVIGVLLAFLAILLVATSTSSGSNIDLALPLLLPLLFGAFALVVPASADATTALLGRFPGPTIRLGASSASRNRRGVTLPTTLLAALACLLVVTVVVGEGLGARESARRGALTALGPATVAGSDRLVLVQSSAFLQPDRPAIDLMTRIRTALPGVEVVDVIGVPLMPRAGRAVLGEVRRTSFFDRSDPAPVDVAVATPKLLAVLGIDPGLARGRSAVVLDARVLRPDRTVRLDPFSVSAPSPATGADRPIALPAVLARRGSLPAGLPAVLLPPATFPTLVGAPSGGSLAIVGFAGRPPTSAEVRAVQAVTSLPVARGDDPVDVLGTLRTDRVDSIGVRSRPDSYRILAETLVVAMAVAALAHLATRLATRREDAILLDLGATRSALARVAVVRAAVVASIGVGLGTVVGFGGVAIGLARYRQSGRFAGPNPLAPIPFTIPAPVWMGLAGLTGLVLLMAVILTLALPARPFVPGLPPGTRFDG